MSMTQKTKCKPPTISDVARHAGVSVMTVSRVINGEKNVRDVTKENVRASIRTLHYVPNISARSLAGNRNYKLALLYSNPSAFYLSELLVGALEEIAKHGHQLLVHKFKENNSPQDVSDKLSTLVDMFDGVLIIPPFADSSHVRTFMKNHDFPAVYLSGRNDRGLNRKVCIDDHAAAYEMTNHLIGLGHRDIAFIKGHPNQYSSKERLRGFTDAMEDAGLTVPKRNVAQGYFTYDSGLEAARKLVMRKPGPPTAIFASNDDMAAACLAVCAASGLNSPADVSIAGFDDSPIASCVYPRLTTVKQPLVTMAATALENLVNLVAAPPEERTSARRIVLPYEIIQGQSTGPVKG